MAQLATFAGESVFLFAFHQAHAHESHPETRGWPVDKILRGGTLNPVVLLCLNNTYVLHHLLLRICRAKSESPSRLFYFGPEEKFTTAKTKTEIHRDFFAQLSYEIGGVCPTWRWHITSNRSTYPKQATPYTVYSI